MGSLYYRQIATAAESAALGVMPRVRVRRADGQASVVGAAAQLLHLDRAVSGMILLIIVAAFILNLTISLTGVAEAMTQVGGGTGLVGHGPDPGAVSCST
jgi:hypothetical protein